MASRSSWLAIAAVGLVAAHGCGGDDTSADRGSGTATGEAGAGVGGSGGGGATGGTSGGTPTGGSGGTSSGTGGSTGVACQQLDACCEELGAAMYSACKSVVNMGLAATCESTLQTYHDSGYCTGSSACAQLATCCPQLPPGEGWRATCENYVEVNNAPQCEYLLATYQQDGYCN